MRRGGFASYTKTGRNIALGRSCGESWARQSSKSSSSGENKGDPPVYIWIIIIVVWFIMFNKISKGPSNQQQQ
jgi:hypothetical protein